MRRAAATFLKYAAAYLATALLAAFITVRLAARGSTVTVPKLVGTEARQAETELKGLGLETSVVGEEHSEAIPAGGIVSQSPAAGTRVKSGRRIKVVLSLGSDIQVMPRLADTRMEEAEFLLRQLGLEVDLVSNTPSSAPRGMVLAQDPAPGARVERSRPVRLLLSDGPAPATSAVPRVTGLTTRDALQKLRGAGLRISDVAYETTSLYAEGTVFAQDPPAGFRASAGEDTRLRAARSGTDGLERYVSFNYVVPQGPARRVRVVVVDEGGSREVSNEIEEGGSILRLSTRVRGQAVAQFYGGGSMLEERTI
jgi:serine/threonine-protein kinase